MIAPPRCPSRYRGVACARPHDHAGGHAARVLMLFLVHALSGRRAIGTVVPVLIHW